jgi:hypothetical protein
MRKLWLLLVFVFVAVAYVISSGPVIAAAMWLSEKPGMEAANSVIVVYYPLLEYCDPAATYIEWCLLLSGVGWCCG